MSQSAILDLIANGHWLVRATNGEYLDIEQDTKGKRRFVTVPIDRARHAFRFSRITDVRARRWDVLLDAVPLTPTADGRLRVDAPASSKATGCQRAAAARVTPAPAAVRGMQLPLQLRHAGCLVFSLAVPRDTLAAARGKPAARAGARSEARGARRAGAVAVPAGAKSGTTGTMSALLAALPGKSTTLAVEIVPAALALAPSGIPFPTFTGMEKRAYDVIAAKLGYDPRSPQLKTSRLAILERPNHIAPKTWNDVVLQLTTEGEARETCENYFHALHSFVQDVFLKSSSSDPVSTVNDLLKLDGGATLQLAIGACFHAMAAGVRGLGFTGSGIVGGALDVAFDVMLADKTASPRDMAIATVKLRDQLASTFDHCVTAIDTMRERAINDWGKIRAIAEMAKDSGHVLADAKSLERMREAARKALEIELWKAMLRLKWLHVTSTNGPRFEEHYAQANADAFMAANPHYWVKFWPTTVWRPFGSSVNGFYVEEHWMGRNGVSHPDAALCNRLFTELGVSREDVFTKAEWGLTPDRFMPPYFPGY